MAKYDGSTISLIANPDGATGLKGNLTVYNNNLYFGYRNLSGKYQLAKYDGSSVSLITNPDAGNGFINESIIVYGNNLYFQYQNAAGKYQLAKYDGTSVSLITSPDAGTGFVSGGNILYNNNLYVVYTNAAGKYQLAKYDGTTINLITNPDGALGVSSNLKVWNGNLYFQYQNTSGKYQLAKYDGTTISLFANPDASHVGFYGNPIIFGNNLYFQYAITTGGFSSTYQLAKFDGSTVSLVPNVSVSDGGFQGAPIVYGSNLYFVYANSSSQNKLAKYDGTSISLIVSPDAGNVNLSSILYNNNLYLEYQNASGKYLLAQLVPPPPTITSFTPASAKPGDAVTITGTNFNTTATNNIVFFGATKASVTAATATSLTVTVPAGASYGPITELNTGTSLACYSLKNFNPIYSPAKSNITNTDFATGVDFVPGSTSSNPQSVAVGDLDGDGKPDLVVANKGDNSVSVFRNTGSSGTITSGSFASPVIFTTGTAPVSVAIGDLDGDGKPDLAVTNYSDNTVSIFRNTATSGSITTGSFANRVSFSTGNSPNWVAIGDLDGDGKPDLAIADLSSTKVSVLQNTSTSGSITTGSFAAKVDFTTGASPFAVAIADIDGDRKPELVVANSDATNISVFQNTASIGSITSGSFAAKVDFSTGTGAYPVGIAIGDLDGDGKPDLVATAFNNTVVVFRNTATLGTIGSGSFATPVGFTTGTFPYAVAIGDVDGDGKPDLAVTNKTSGTTSIFRNTVTSGISSSSFAAKVDFTTGTSPYFVTISDLDGDGKPDLTVLNTTRFVTVLRNTDIVLPPTITSFTPINAKPGDAVTITGTNFNTTASNNIVFFGATKATVTAATATQLTVTVPTGATYAPITELNTGTNLACYSLSNFNPIYSPAKTGITGSDFSAHVDFTTGTAPLAVAIGDLDGDGKPDLAVVNSTSNTVSIYRNTASSGSITTGSFASKVDFATGNFPNSVAIGDVDGDGKPDLIVTNTTDNTVSVLRNTASSGSITTSSFAAHVDFATGTSPQSVAIGDLDADGKLDLAIANFSTNVSVLRNTSSIGSISFAAKLDIAVGGGSQSIAIGDLDGDGKLDLALARGGLEVLRNTSSVGSISFAAYVSFTSGAVPYSVAIGDLDGDGKPDIAIANYVSATVSVFRNTATSGNLDNSSFTSKVDFVTSSGTASLAIGDFDGDGKPDLAAISNTNSKVSILRNTATSGTITTGSFAVKVDFATGTYPNGVAIGDLDGDGRPDVVTANNANTVSVLRNADIPTTISSFSPSSGPVGTLVTITGTNLSNPTSITIGAVSAVVISNTGTSLVAMVMPGASTGGISVTTANGTANATGNFTVTASQTPNAQQGNKLVGTGAVGAANQGQSIAVSADGNTAIVGGSNDNSGVGAAWVYTRSGSTWTQQGSKLVGTGTVGTVMHQGYRNSVAISADGNTAIVGGYYDNSGVGAAWVFTRSGSSWTQQGAKLVGTGNTGNANQGCSVALSADGNTAAIGGNSDNNAMGAVWIFTRSGSTWTQQGTKLVGTGATGTTVFQGQTVALSADGNTTLIGGYNDNNGVGAVWVFTRSGNTWTQQGTKLVGTGAIGSSRQGAAVALSADGNTAIVGGSADNGGIGGTWVFTRSGGTWTQQGNKLLGTDITGNNIQQGNSVAVSADGNTAVVGGSVDNISVGATWVFTRNGSNWTQAGPKLIATDGTGNTALGIAVAISADGNTAFAGGSNDNSGAGAAWAYTYVPSNTLDKLSLTGATPASAAYSLRKLSSSYTGNAILVRRSSDNSTQNIGFTGGGDLDTTALKTFAGSGDAFVVTWYDQSFVNDATQTTAASQPRIVAAGVVERLNGKPAVNFLGAQTLNISLYTNVVASGSNPSTINCVAKLNTNTGYQDVFSSGATVNSSPRSLGSTNNGLLYNSNGVNENDGIISSISQFIATGNFTSTNETLNSQNINPNGTLSTTSVATVPNSGLLLAAANIGSKASSQHIWNGYIQEITLFNSSLSNTDNTSVQNSQLTYYSGPQITASAISSALSTSAGTASSTANFTVSGAYMTAGILVTAPTGYEVSSSASGPFSSSLTVGAAGTIASTTVYIRLASTTAIGYYNGAIALTSSGATTANVLVGGTVLYAPPAISYGVTGTQVYSPGTIITPLNLSNTGGAVLAQAANGVSVFAGTSAFGSTDGPAASASFNSIGGIAIDTSGNVYVADQANSKIRKISAGTVSTFAGSGGGGLASNGNTVDGAAASATFYYPTGVAVDAAGNVFVADGNKIRKISAGVVSTFATISCKSLAVDAAGNLYVVSNSGDNKIYKITANGFVSTLAGNGSAGSVDGLAAAASFNGVYGIAVDAVGNVYVADANNSKVRKITAAGVVSTLAGSGSQGQMDGIGAAALFTYPTGIGTDAAGNVYVSENLNGWGTIRKITPDATVKTISSGWQYPNSIVTDKAFNVYWGLGAGNAGNQVILLSQQGYAISPALPAGLHFDSTNGKISGTPTAYSPATTYTITATNAGGSSTTTLSIQVTGSITAGTASGTMTTCVGSASVSPKIQQFTVSGAFLTDNILVTAPANFEVSLASGSGYGSTVTLNQSGGTVNSTTIYVRLAASATVGNKADSVVLTSTGGVTTQKVGVAGTVYQYPVLNPIQGTLSVCVGNTTTLTAVSPASVTTDTLHATNPKSLSIPTNTGSGTADQTMGNIAPVTFNAYQKIWSSDNPAVATVDATTGVVTGVSAGTANITCSVIGNCTTTQTAVVTVNPLPVLPAITGNTTVLVNSTSTLSNATTGGTWSSSNTAIATVISSTGVVKGITAGKDTITYAYTNGNGCSSSISTPINVVAIAPITGTTNVCAGSTTQLADATPNGTWSSSDVTKATIDATGTVTGISAGNVTITYTITGTGAVTTAFTVNALPIGSISAANGSIICGTGGSIVLTGSGGDTYAWTKGGTAITTTTASQLTVTAPAVYTATVTNSTTGCSAPAGNSITVTQLFAPKASFVYDSYCVNKPITFTNQSIVTTSGPVNYAWSDNNGNSSTGSNASFTYSSVGGYSVKLKVIPQVCPNIADSSTKVIPVESAIPGVRYPRIDAVVNNPTPLQARSFGSAYLWSPGTGISNTAIANPTVKIKTESNYTVQITVVSGCTTTDTVLVRAFDVNIYVPNVFSPNGDGINDVLYVNLINIKQLKFFRIYDRWGKKLFETNDPTQGWDGKTNGVLQHIDTYTWVAEAVDNNGTYVTKEGSVTLLR